MDHSVYQLGTIKGLMKDSVLTSYDTALYLYFLGIFS